MIRSLKRFRARALARPDVKKAYDELKEEFADLDEVLRARAESRQRPQLDEPRKPVGRQ